ncbi:hypothetical protein SAMN05443377_1058 [Propionibacterium cyclohexanicum]|uniref:YgjP-like metallopeptidase domain-containing protein n=1 Tax=Propionibacterium cyclohexanicum TaxID=64702 RepID=A0A1H9QYJ6_9ACTN|nr:hypothetical protein SAMN05443377_1058 [Propionibacterium cyclohexanicum]
MMLVPAGLNLARETELARILLERLARRRAKQVQTRSDEALMARALQLRDSYLPQVPVPAQVRWSGDQITRWGSCTSADASIRISTQLCAMPQWVIDHVLMHEMVHLVHADHGTGFHELLAACPFTERARGFLEGWAMATSTPPDGGQDLLPGS